MIDVMVKRFEAPDETRRFEKGKFELVNLGELTIGRASYEPGWKWSEHVAPLAETATCDVAHIGIVLSGCVKVLMNDGQEFELRAGDVFQIGPGHDSWVVGEEPYVSLHFFGAGDYAKETETAR
ncbi:MAG: cupin domain-containing protein [Acidobacteria bacterium]|nr:cupin domain-containing protein [Acidobacteriota bacterium]